MNVAAKWGTLLLVMAITALVVWWLWPLPAAIGHDNLRYVQLLRTACSSQREDYLSGVEKALQLRRSEGKIPPEEWNEFEKIVRLARNGDWSSADRAVQRLEAAQLDRRRAPIDPSSLASP
jgi:hypothetical protein